MEDRPAARQYLEPLPVALLDRPLDYLLSDHHRQRVLCTLCDELARQDPIDGERAVEVIGHVSRDLAIHVIDEEQDLFPLLRRRATVADGIEPILGQLSGEHARDESLAATIVDGLRDAVAAPGMPAPPELRTALRAFARTQRQHLALENATVMPLARQRLTTMDLAGLASRMAARRGVDLDSDREPAGDR